MRETKIDYNIYGDDLQYVEIELDPGETVIAESGALMTMDDGILFEAKLGDGSEADQGLFSKLKRAGSRMLSNESLFLTHFTNQARQKKRLCFASPAPGRIIPMDLGELGGSVTCQSGSFLCGVKGINVEFAFNKNLGAGFFGGEGFILQKLTGRGKVFTHACGGIMLRKLEHSKILVDPGCIVGFTSGIQFKIERSGSLKSMFFGGEGFFLASLSGTGYVWLQSMPFTKLAHKLGDELQGRFSGGGSSSSSLITDELAEEAVGGLINLFKK